MKDDVCTSRKAAEILGVTPRTIQLWADAGILNSWKTPGGHRRFYLSAVTALAQEILEGKSPLLNDAAQDTPKPVKKPVIEPAKVLVVDDDKTLLRLYELAIHSWGLPVELFLASDGYQGLIQVGQYSPDLLILDLQMPNIDGFAVIDALKKQNLLKQMSLMIISGLEQEDISEHRSLLDEFTVIQKPVPFLKIREAVEHILLNR